LTIIFRCLWSAWWITLL